MSGLSRAKREWIMRNGTPEQKEALFGQVGHPVFLTPHQLTVMHRELKKEKSNG